MVTNIDFIHLTLQTFIAFVAFATIVATLRQSFGTALKPFQYLLFRFFVEIGLLNVLILLFVAMMYNLYPDEQPMIWFSTTILILLVIPFFLVYYFIRRAKVQTVTPWLSKLLLLLTIVVLLALGVTLTGLWVKPSAYTVAPYLLWAMVVEFSIFLFFLGSFVHQETD